MGKRGASFVLMCCLVGWAACTKHATMREGKAYTQLDSLTDTYLNLQDSLLITWNVMARDENEKLRALQELLQSMNGSGYFNKSEVEALEQRLEQVERIRFNQKTMSNPHVVEEYDFASNSLISEIVSMAEASPAFIQKKEFQSRIDYIKSADQRVEYYRADYDYIAQKFNLFLDQYETQIKEIDQNGLHQKRPLFQMASDN